MLQKLLYPYNMYIILSTTCSLFGSVLDISSCIWVLECLSIFESGVWVFVSFVVSSGRLIKFELKVAINHDL